MRLQTRAGLLDAALLADGRIAVDMGAPRTDWRDIPLAQPTDTLRADIAAGPLAGPICTNIGNPHATFFVADADSVDLAALGPVLEHHPLFPERANIGVATVHAAPRDPRGARRDPAARLGTRRRHHARLRQWRLRRACRRAS